MSGSILRVAHLTPNKPEPFKLVPDGDAREAIAGRLGLLGLKKLSFEGILHPDGKQDWKLTAQLGATVVQPCVINLSPVTTRITDNVERFFTQTLPDVPETGEVEMPDDETIDELGAEIDLGFLMEEALALALPAYPRSENAALDEAQFTEPGKAAMTDEDARPFAGLKDLRDKLEDKGS